MKDLSVLKQDLLYETQRCSDLFNSQVFIHHHIFTQSAFIELLIRLNYVLQELSKKNCRIIWNDDIETSKGIIDITDLVNYLRNAAVHSESQRNYVKNTTIKFVFNTFIGKCPNAVMLGEGIFLGNEYQDDIAFYYGDKRVYLIRHIKRLIAELPNDIDKLK